MPHLADLVTLLCEGRHEIMSLLIVLPFIDMKTMFDEEYNSTCYNDL